jgi:drug/metabolite transporter superfamily protein YnfA
MLTLLENPDFWFGWWLAGIVLCIGSCLWSSRSKYSVVTRAQLLALLVLSIIPFIQTVLTLISFGEVYAGTAHARGRFWDKPAIDFSKRK